MQARIQLESGWLLNARPYGETSLLLEAFTETQGRVGLIAKGARGPRSKTRGLLQPLQPLLLSWTQRGELAGLSGVEAAGPPVGLQGERLFYGWYLNELLLKLLQRHDPHPDVYLAYADTLPRLAGGEAEFALRLFEKRLLADIGYGLPLPGTLDADLRYVFEDDAGFVPAARGYSGRSLIALREGSLPGEGAAEIAVELRQLLRGLIRRQLGGRELETSKLLRGMRDKMAHTNPAAE